jgi:hypothetical protein
VRGARRAEWRECRPLAGSGIVAFDCRQWPVQVAVGVVVAADDHDLPIGQKKRAVAGARRGHAAGQRPGIRRRVVEFGGGRNRSVGGGRQAAPAAHDHYPAIGQHGRRLGVVAQEVRGRGLAPQVGRGVVNIRRGGMRDDVVAGQLAAGDEHPAIMEGSNDVLPGAWAGNWPNYLPAVGRRVIELGGLTLLTRIDGDEDAAIGQHRRGGCVGERPRWRGREPAARRCFRRMDRTGGRQDSQEGGDKTKRDQPARQPGRAGHRTSCPMFAHDASSGAAGMTRTRAAMVGCKNKPRQHGKLAGPSPQSRIISSRVSSGAGGLISQIASLPDRRDAFFDGHQRCRPAPGDRAPGMNRQREGGCGDIIGEFP